MIWFGQISLCKIIVSTHSFHNQDFAWFSILLELSLQLKLEYSG